jgi:transmembrane sensor
MTDRPSAEDRLFAEALDLVIRLQSDPDNAVARDLVKRWRARGADHEAAWAEVAEIHGMAGAVLERRGRANAGGAVSRRGVLLGGAAALAVAGTGALVGPELLLRARAEHMTATAEVRRIVLTDGSVVSLGPDSAIRSVMEPGQRLVDMLDGMAFFEAAPDAARPFRVRTGALTATALGTAFDISRDAGLVTLAVEHGVVQASMPGSPPARGEALAAGDWLVLDERAGTIARGRRDPDQMAAWRDGLIIAEHETVAAVVARIARWQPGRVVIADPGLGRRPISGVFDLGKPIAALEAVIQPHGGRVRQVGPWLTVLSMI